jgi:hypothetical protein
LLCVGCGLACFDLCVRNMTMDMLAARTIIIRIPAPKPAAKPILSFGLSEDEVCGTVVPVVKEVAEAADLREAVVLVLLVLGIKAFEAVIEEVAEATD